MVKPNKNQAEKTPPSDFFRKAFLNGKKGLKLIFLFFSLFCRVSGRKIRASKKFAKAKMPTKIKGTRCENEDKRPPSIGPIINPMPKTAPKVPRLAVLSFLFLAKSIKQLCAVEKLPAAKPSIILPKNKKRMFGAKAKTSQPKEVLKMLARSTILRPILSDSEPKKGALKKAQKEKAENKRVITQGGAPKVLT